MRGIMLVAVSGLIVSCSESQPATGEQRSSLVSRTVVIDGVAVPVQRPAVLGRARGTPVLTHTVGYDPRECGIPGGLASDPACRTDGDGDRVVARFDCDDADPTVSPRTFDIPCDGFDQNCNGFDECDADGDGEDSVADLDDSDPAVGWRAPAP